MNTEHQQQTSLKNQVLEATKRGPGYQWVRRISALAERAGLATQAINWIGSPEQVAFHLVQSIAGNKDAIRDLEQILKDASKSAHPFSIRGRPFKFEIELSGESYHVEIEDTGSHASYFGPNRTAGFSIQPVIIGQNMIIGLFFKNEEWVAQILGPKNSEVKYLEIKVP